VCVWGGGGGGNTRAKTSFFVQHLYDPLSNFRDELELRDEYSHKHCLVSDELLEIEDSGLYEAIYIFIYIYIYIYIYPSGGGGDQNRVKDKSY